MKVFLVTDGIEDLYGVFTTRENAQAWIDRQTAYPWKDGLQIEERPLDEAPDLRRTDE